MTDDLAGGFQSVDAAADFAVFSSCLTLIESLPFFAECKRASYDVVGATLGRRILEVGCGTWRRRRGTGKARSTGWFRRRRRWKPGHDHGGGRCRRAAGGGRVGTASSLPRRAHRRVDRLVDRSAESVLEKLRCPPLNCMVTPVTVEISRLVFSEASTWIRYFVKGPTNPYFSPCLNEPNDGAVVTFLVPML